MAFVGQGSTAIVNATLVTTAATVIASTPIIEVPRDSDSAIIMAWCNITTGAGANAVQPQIVRGVLATSPVVAGANDINAGVTAGTRQEWNIMGFDAVSLLATVQYSLVFTQEAATANGTVNQVMIAAFFIF